MLVGILFQKRSQEVLSLEGGLYKAPEKMRKGKIDGNLPPEGKLS